MHAAALSLRSALTVSEKYGSLAVLTAALHRIIQLTFKR